MKPFMGWIVAVVLVSAIFIFALVTEGWWGVWVALTQMLAIVVGGFLGSFLMREAYKRFGWGESATRSVYWWVVVSGIILMLVLFVLGPVLGIQISNEPNLATITFWTAFGVWAGCVSRVRMIRKQLRTEESRP
jgi:H+/Cl- antiporter ClcA